MTLTCMYARQQKDFWGLVYYQQNLMDLILEVWVYLINENAKGIFK